MSNIAELANVPEIDFIGGMTLESTEQKMRDDFQMAYEEITGEEYDLTDGDIVTLLIKADALIDYQMMQFIDIKGRAEMLKTSTGTFLDAFAAFLGAIRMPATKATATERFTLSEAQPQVVGIPAGTRVRTQDEIYFNTVEYAEIPIGETYVDVKIQAEEAGTESDGVSVGMIDTLVDPIPYVAAVTNTTESSGGLDAEDDDSLTRRAYLSPSKFSCAGPTDAYEYYVREWRSDVGDVRIVSPSPCVLSIYVVLKDGSLLSEEEKASLIEYINGDTIRPTTDQLVCVDPTEIEYDITLTYYIGRSNQNAVASIQEAVDTAIADYQVWQRKLGNDISPTEIIGRLRDAGVKRVVLTAPTDVVVSDYQLPKAGTVTVTYGGLEDD